MSWRTLGGLLSLVLVTACASAESNSSPIGRTAALEAPVTDLAKSALAAVSTKLVEVERPAFSGLRGRDAPITGLRFATAARSSGNPGLCEATVVWVNTAGSSPPIATDTVYKVVGSLAPLPDMWNDAYGAELERKCGAAGRAIASSNADFDHVWFFTFSGGEKYHVWQAAQALDIAISDAKNGAAVTCPSWTGIDAEVLATIDPSDPELLEDRENKKGCAAPGAILAGLSLDRLQAIELTSCTDPAPNEFCASAIFLRRAYENHQVLWEVQVRYRRQADHALPSLIGPIVLSPSYSVYD